MVLLHLPFLLALWLCGAGLPALARQAKENRRDFQKLDGEALDRLASLPPAQWESVDEGHLQRMLIPRAGGWAPSFSSNMIMG